jgi:NADPH-ferrihemoprotein reductase
MGLDILDYSVLVALAIAVSVYFSKGVLWAVEDDGTKVVTTSREIAQVVRDNNKEFLIFYGSQTGTAEDYAQKFAKELKSKFRLNVMVADLEDYDFESLNELDVIVGFLISSYGEGDFPDSSIAFESHLNTLGEGELSNLRYTLFGLGNSTYEFYNGAAGKANSLLKNAGATLIGAYGQGDDGAGTLDEDYLSWKEATLETLKDVLKLEEHESSFEPSLTLLRLDPGEYDEDKIFLGEPDKSYLNPSVDQSKGPFDHAHPYLAPISSSKELFNSTDRSCIHAEFDLSNTNLRYSTGDHLAVWPSNSTEILEKFLKITGLSEDKEVVYDLKPMDSTVVIPFPTPAPVEAIFRHYKEISGPVSRQTVSNLKQYAPTEKAKAEADRLGKDKNAFASEIHAKKYDFSDVLSILSDGVQWNLPLEFLIESLPHLQPRYYSISSSSLTEKTSIHITAVVEAEEFDGRLISGVATNLIRNIEIEQNKESAKPHLSYNLDGPRSLFSKFKLPVHVRRSTFRLPSNPATPVILIGPGTGVAPFRGFIRDRVQQAKNGTKDIGKALLFYGSRNSNEDFLYKEEWPEYSKVLGESFELITAFSRESAKKVYVQHKIKEREDEILALLDQGAFVYVCGDASKMAKEVNETLVDIWARGKGVPHEEAHELLKDFKTTNRYQEDVW